jgi:hypothetical protein
MAGTPVLCPGCSASVATSDRICADCGLDLEASAKWGRPIWPRNAPKWPPRDTVLWSVLAPAAIGGVPLVLYLLADPPPYMEWDAGWLVVLLLIPATGFVAGLLGRVAKSLPFLFGSFFVAQTLAASFSVCDSSGACGPLAGGFELAPLLVFFLGLGPMAVTAFISRPSSDARAVGPGWTSDWTCGRCGCQVRRGAWRCTNCGALRTNTTPGP